MKFVSNEILAYCESHSNKDSELLKQLKKFKVLCAGSTHNTEEILISKLHIKLKKSQKILKVK